MPKIYDNIEHHLHKGLNDTLEVSYRSDFCVGYFNLRGWKKVADNIDKWDGGDNNCCRLLVGMQKAPLDTLKEYLYRTEEIPIDNLKANSIKKKLAQEFKDQLTIGIPTESDEIGLRKLSQQLKDKKVIVKLFLKHQLHAKLYLLFRDDKINPIIGYLGSSNLTLAGLLKQGELNIDVLDHDASLKLSKWFNERWEDRWCIDISKDLIEIIDNSWAADRLVSPYHIYLKMAYHLSQEARAGINEFKIPKVFQNKLLDFQQKAVLISAHYLNKRGGVIIGDVVGLGKTIIATALAKIFEDDLSLETLILCPKNLTNMWEDYAYQYQLRAKVLSTSIAQTNLKDVRRYRIVIIDESHNLRNREGKRYRAIQEYIALNDSKVILLSATPYNKTFIDLSSQLRLFIPDDMDIGISPERFIKSIGGKVQFMAKYQTPLRCLPAFEKSDFVDDWRELMRLYLVRRTRNFVKINYGVLDPENNRKFLLFPDGTRSYFPDRIPKKVEYHFNPKDPLDQYARLYSNNVIDVINGLELPRYGLANYLDTNSKVKASSDEEIIKGNLSRAGKRLIGFCRTNLFKRLESSGYSFLLSLSRHVIRNYIFIYAMENDLAIPIGSQDVSILDYFQDDDDPDRVETNNILMDAQDYYNHASEVHSLYNTKDKNKYDWIRSGLFKKELKEDLLNDSSEIIKILRLAMDWKPENDRQLNALYDLCTKKHPNEKILIFTQFADTANYLSKELKKRGLEQLECVTGDNDNPTEFAYRFSPVSNGKKDRISKDRELRVLISTDVLSEGQNLQDAHIIVNYDLPWALIRLIQRAGRVDRIGQKSEEIICYSFLPEDGIESIINLRKRLTHRIKENSEVVGSDETFFDGDPVNIHDLYNEKSGILDDNDDGEVDLASYAYQIWKNAIDADPKLQKIIPEMPNVTYATKEITQDEKVGVIVYTRTAEDNDILAWLNRAGEIITQSQLTILKAAECSADTLAIEKIENHHELVEKGIGYIKVHEKGIGGQLGKKSGVKYRVYMRLDNYCKDYDGTLFIPETLKRAMQDIYDYPLKEFARETLNRQLKSGLGDVDLASLIVSLKEEGRLCAIKDDDEKIHREPQIICSLGLVKG